MYGFLSGKFKYSWLFIVMTGCIFMMRVFADEPADIPPPKEKYSEETLCVEPVEIMRKQHFEFLLDHRDATVIQGIRTKQYSLTGCIDCHITPNTQGEYARYSEATHFCANCHQFTAVTIDCFQCHADRPEQVIRKTLAANTTSTNDTQALQEYLQLSGAYSH